MMNLLKMFKKKPGISDFVHDEPVNESDVDQDAGSEAVLIDETTFVSDKKAKKLKAKKDHGLKNDAGMKYVMDCRIESGAHLYFELMPDGNVTQVPEPFGLPLGGTADKAAVEMVILLQSTVIAPQHTDTLVAESL